MISSPNHRSRPRRICRRCSMTPPTVAATLNLLQEALQEAASEPARREPSDDSRRFRVTREFTPTRRRRRSAARCRRRSRWRRPRSRRIRRWRRPRIICSPIPMRRSRGRRCCRSPRCRTGSMQPGSTDRPRSRAGISKFPSRRRRARRWRSSRFRATAAASRSTPRKGSGARASRSTSSRPARCMRWSRWSATRRRCGCGQSGRRPRRSFAPAPPNSAAH